MRTAKGVALFLLPILLVACTTSTNTIRLQHQKTTTISSSTLDKIFIMEPQIRFEDQKTTKKLPSSRFLGEKVRQQLIQTAAEKLKEHGFTTYVVPHQPDFIALSSISRQLVVEKPKKYVIDQLISLCSHKDYGIFVQHLKVKVGLNSFWNPISGAIGPKTHTSYLQAALIDCAKSKIIWRNSVFFRGIANPRNLSKPLEALYRTISIE